jgi:hypothetical protein
VDDVLTVEDTAGEVEVAGALDVVAGLDVVEEVEDVVVVVLDVVAGADVVVLLDVVAGGDVAVPEVVDAAAVDVVALSEAPPQPVSSARHALSATPLTPDRLNRCSNISRIS